MYLRTTGNAPGGTGGMTITITRELPDSRDAVILITELSDYLDPLYPKWNQFGLSPDRMIKEGVAFFITRVDGMPAGCGGIKFYEGFGELKRMYVRPQFRGTGLGKLMLKHLEMFAHQQGTTVLRLETGIYQPEAMGLYERMSYRLIPPFEPYDASTATLSRFYEKIIF
jgi:GNAT superfamily N-acetyltransferase